MYAILKDDIEQKVSGYSEDFKKEFDQRYDNYISAEKW